jgi:serine/threonine-protein kinase
MSPECFGKGELSAATDVYALGCVMYEALTGSPPVVANTISETVMKVMTETPKPIAPSLRVPEELQALIFSMLAKDPGERPTTPVVLQSLIALQAKTPSRT